MLTVAFVWWTLAGCGEESGAASLAVVPASELARDLVTLHETLERMHAGVHRYTSKSELDAAFRDAEGRLGDGMTVLQFYRVVCRVVALVRCGHTRATLVEPMRTDALASRPRFPCAVRLVDDRAYIMDASLSAQGVSRGSEIRAIDHRPMAAILAELCDLVPDDGHIVTGKRREIEQQFAMDYALLVSGAGKSFVLDVVVPGSTDVRSVVVAGSMMRPPEPPAPPPIALRIDASGRYAILDVRAFGDGSLRATGLDFPKVLEQSFATLEERDVRALIVDLRGNGGGRDQYGALLVSYLTDKPFRYFERIEVTEAYSGPGTVERAADGTRRVTSHPGLRMQEPSAHSFLGKIVMLVDGGTFSTAADVATVTHYLKLATLVGEETGGGYDGNTSGSSETLVLPASKIVVSIPHWMYTTANPGHDRHGRGAPVDVPGMPNVDDLVRGIDRGLEVALGLIGEK